MPAAMSRGGGKGTSLKDKLDGNELDLSLCDLNEVPVRELVSVRAARRGRGRSPGDRHCQPGAWKGAARGSQMCAGEPDVPEVFATRHADI